MASPVADLEASLQAMLSLKPPGVSGSRITGITGLCVDNVPSESVLIQKIYTHFKKAPGTHKLGVLYVVDSVTRKWLERAKALGQAVNTAAQDGTFAAGVHRVTELMPVLMNDIIASAPSDQKDKLRKLVDIWEKGQTFPTDMVQSFKDRLTMNQSTTPTNSPPPAPAVPVAPKTTVSAAVLPNSAAVMQALANMARQNTAAMPPAVSNHLNYTSHEAFSQPIPLPQPALSGTANLGPLGLPFRTPLAAVSAAGPPFSFPPPIPAPTQSGIVPNPTIPAAGTANGFLAGLAGLGPTLLSQNPVMGLDPNMQQQLMLIQALHAQGVPFDQIPALIQTMAAAGATAASLTGFPAPAAAQTWPVSRSEEPRDRIAEPVRSPRFGNRAGSRSRSRTRPTSRSRSNSPRRWGSPRGGAREFGRNSPGRDRERDHGRRPTEYRQRSPQSRRDRSSSPPARQGPKWMEFDPSLPTGHIKVFSRTLFVGGVTCSEQELNRIFATFGKVQTCIVNKDKRHAFVKMVTRADAEKAMKDKRIVDYQLRTKWGVGFGPRDCSDYSSGISIIPIHKLTEADRKWLLTAEYGGTGGKPIDSGLCCEEPDIEIGKGVSSKAISRRMQTDKSGANGPKSSRSRDDDADDVHWRRGRNDNRRDNDDRDSDTPSATTNAALGPAGGNPMAFPFGFGAMPGGMPAFAAGFMFPQQDQQK